MSTDLIVPQLFDKDKPLGLLHYPKMWIRAIIFELSIFIVIGIDKPCKTLKKDNPPTEFYRLVVKSYPY